MLLVAKIIHTYLGMMDSMVQNCDEAVMGDATKILTGMSYIRSFNAMKKELISFMNMGIKTRSLGIFIEWDRTSMATEDEAEYIRAETLLVIEELEYKLNKIKKFIRMRGFDI